MSVQTVTCTLKATVREVIELLVENHIHRVFLVDDDEKLIGVVALRDVLALFVKEPSDSKLGDYFTA